MFWSGTLNNRRTKHVMNDQYHKIKLVCNFKENSSIFLCLNLAHNAFATWWIHLVMWSGPTATNWVRYSASIPYSSVEDVFNWENSQITAANTAEYILSWVRFSGSQLYSTPFFSRIQAVSRNVQSTQNEIYTAGMMFVT